MDCKPWAFKSHGLPPRRILPWDIHGSLSALTTDNWVHHAIASHPSGFYSGLAHREPCLRAFNSSRAVRQFGLKLLYQAASGHQA